MDMVITDCYRMFKKLHILLSPFMLNINKTTLKLFEIFL